MTMKSRVVWVNTFCASAWYSAGLRTFFCFFRSEIFGLMM